MKFERESLSQSSVIEELVRLLLHLGFLHDLVDLPFFVRLPASGAGLTSLHVAVVALRAIQVLEVRLKDGTVHADAKVLIEQALVLLLNDEELGCGGCDDDTDLSLHELGVQSLAELLLHLELEALFVILLALLRFACLLRTFILGLC